MGFGAVSSLSGQSSAVVISQVYGGGGNAGASLRNDFIEIFNRGNAAVDLTAWSVQYASATGTTWDRTILGGFIQPGQYYLIQEAQGAGGSTSLPAPEATGGINLSATSGKVALVNNSIALNGSAPNGAQVVDFLGYGGADFAEGRPVDPLNNTSAAIRRSGGCADTNNNQADFALGAPSPRNTRSSLNPCGPVGPQISNGGITNAASFMAGAVAPGEIVTIFGSSLGPASLAALQLTVDRQYVTKSLAGTRVLFDGVASPMIYTLAGQVSAIAPYPLAGRATTQVQVEYNGQLSNAVTLAVAPSAPGVFTVGSSGQGQAAVLNQDYTVNGPSNPAARGSVVAIYATGGGQTTPDGDDGRVIGADLPKLLLPVRVKIAGLDAEVLYTGAAPGLVSGAVQINARIPDSAPGGASPMVITVGGAGSQPGVAVSVAGPGSGQPGVGAFIDQKLDQLKHDPTVAPLSEIPTDRSPIPPAWLALVSWNTQVGATATSVDATRPPMVKAALSTLFNGTYQILAAQEIPNKDSAELLRNLLPGGGPEWKTSFFDTTDSMDNGFWYRSSTVLRDSFSLFVTGQTDASGRFIADTSRAQHPPQVAQFQIDDFDFTLITVHLTFADGDTAESARELHNVLDYLDWYFNQPDHDPDVIVCGDFNMPSALSGQTGKNGITLDALFDQDPRFQQGERRFVVTVHEPTSRGSAASGGVPVSNYDHCVLSADTMKEFVQARRVSTNILTDNPSDPEVQLTSDHFPIVAFFRTKGDGIALDLKTRIRP